MKPLEPDRNQKLKKLRHSTVRNFDAVFSTRGGFGTFVKSSTTIWRVLALVDITSISSENLLPKFLMARYHRMQNDSTELH
ncbi:hypothetical protein DPMN_127476 [Dreissena polymorpha]|uniref:Uncharacterized protein n=1 Tax=Dreissena polymorpha TaxID=45954 RepID=A0A9D4H214_DREPO|nr:hypothetical protein DPMN_127476 [Dreissena polymorpha]